MGRLAAKLTVYAGILLGLQVAAVCLFPDWGVPSPVLVCDELLDEGTDVVYFGDSTLYRDHPEEGRTATLPERVDALLPGYSVGAVAHDAYQPDLYAAFCRYMAGRKGIPKAVIMTLNLRAFSVERDRRPEYQFAKEKLFLRHDGLLGRAFVRPLAIWGYHDFQPVSQEAYEETPVFEGERLLGTVRELSPPAGAAMEGDVLRRFITLCYMTGIEPDHRQLLALSDIVETCEAAGIAVLFYLTPVDYELGNDQFGPEFQTRIEENARTVATALEGTDAVFLDLSTALGREAFALNAYPEAYLRDSGKGAVAQRLARAVAEVLASRK